MISAARSIRSSCSCAATTQPPWGRERGLDDHEHVQLQHNPPGEGSAVSKIMFMPPFMPPIMPSIMPSAASCDEGSPGRPHQLSIFLRRCSPAEGGVVPHRSAGLRLHQLPHRMPSLCTHRLPLHASPAGITSSSVYPRLDPRLHPTGTGYVYL